MSKSLLSKILLVSMTLVVLNGCLTSLKPFYQSEQIIEDSRLLGSYRDEKAGHVWTIERGRERSNRYVATLSQQESWSKYLLTLFRFNGRTYLDIFPEGDSSLTRDPGGPPTMSQIMRGLTSQPLHLLVEVEMADAQLQLAVISRLGLNELRKIRPNLRLLGEDGVIPVPYATGELQLLLTEIAGNDKVFDQKLVLKKDPASISRPIESKCPNCLYAFTVMSADAEDHDESWRVRCPSCGYNYSQLKTQPDSAGEAARGVMLLKGSM